MSLLDIEATDRLYSKHPEEHGTCTRLEYDKVTNTWSRVPDTDPGIGASTPPGRKDDAGKPPMALLPWRALREVAKVLAYGAKRYGKNNWQALQDFEERYANAMLRHLTCWKSGENNDEESGLPHLAHLACDALFLLAKEVGFDAR